MGETSRKRDRIKYGDLHTGLDEIIRRSKESRRQHRRLIKRDAVPDAILIPDESLQEVLQVQLSYGKTGSPITRSFLEHELLFSRLLRARAGVGAGWFTTRLPSILNAATNDAQPESWVTCRFSSATAEKAQASLLKSLLDPQKLNTRNTRLNDKFPFLTTRLLWCSRYIPISRHQKLIEALGPGTDPSIWSVELNADIVNAYITLLIEHYANKLVLVLSTDFSNQFKVHLSVDPKHTVTSSSNIKTRSIPPGRSTQRQHNSNPTNSSATCHQKQHRITTTTPPPASNHNDTTRFEEFLSNWSGETVSRVREMKPRLSTADLYARLTRFMNRHEYDFWKHDYVLWPYNYCDNHWVLIVVDTRNKQLLWLDSLLNLYTNYVKSQLKTDGGLAHSLLPLEDSVIRYPGFVALQLIGDYLSHDWDRRNPDRIGKYDGWQTNIVAGLPQQPAGSLDCGVYMCQYIRSILRNTNPLSFDFDHNDIQGIREHMTLSLGAGKILTSDDDVISFHRSQEIGIP